MVQRWDAGVDDRIWKHEDGEFVLYEDYEEVRLLLAKCLTELEAEPEEIGCHVGRHAKRNFLQRVREAVNGT